MLADGIAELTLSYFGRDADAADADAPTWRDAGTDTQLLPLLIRIDVKPTKGAPWPTLVVAPRDAPEAGCRGWDIDAPVRSACVAMADAMPLRRAARAARHRADRWCCGSRCC